MPKIPIAILAATGSVGQRMVQLVDNHPWFEVIALTASDRSVGLPYGQACHWLLPTPMPAWAQSMIVQPNELSSTPVKLALSALPADIAKTAEPVFAKAGINLCSNASAYRRDALVPILLPEVNPEHAAIIPIQRREYSWKGCIVTNPNCTSTGLTVVLKALQDNFGLKRVMAVSLQALSGAGYPGVASMDIIDNVIPFVSGEEAKLEWEPRKMLGSLVGSEIRLADFVISAQTNRVNVSDGHIVCCSIELGEKAKTDEIMQALEAYQAPEISRDLPSTPSPAIVVRTEEDRPQPRLDRDLGRGMTTVVGRIRPDPLLDLKMVVLSHNTVRGAAGGSIYNAELLVKLNLV